MNGLRIGDIAGRKSRFGFHSAQDLEYAEGCLVFQVKALKRELENVQMLNALNSASGVIRKQRDAAFTEEGRSWLLE